LYVTAAAIVGDKFKLKKELVPVNVPDKSALGDPAPVKVVVEFEPAVKVPELVNKVPEFPVIVKVDALIFKVPVGEIVTLFAVRVLLEAVVSKVVPPPTVRLPDIVMLLLKLFVPPPEVIKLP
jgi:hypothetical protein